MMTVFAMIAILIVAASFVDLGIGALATIASDVFNALRRLFGTGSSSPTSVERWQK